VGFAPGHGLGPDGVGADAGRLFPFSRRPGAIRCRSGAIIRGLCTIPSGSQQDVLGSLCVIVEHCATSPYAKCDGLARISQQGGDPFAFDTLNGKKLWIPLEPKALHDEMNAASFDEFGRMTANLGVEAVPATPGAQTVILYPFVNPQTELIDASGLPVGDVNVTPISSATDGTQIWKITHNGVDTHPIHFHLFDVQVINRVTWDNIIIPTEPSELGWKDTVRVSPLEDTIVALRPILPVLPFEIPNSVRLLNPMMLAGDTSMFNSVDPNGNPAAAITNRVVNFGWEYVFHCHILSHEEMDMMRPVSVVVAPIKGGTLASRHHCWPRQKQPQRAARSERQRHTRRRSRSSVLSTLAQAPALRWSA
jgi:Multicopper oxidase